MFRLPARGKTHVSRSLSRYLRWLGVQTAVFSLGNYRRQIIGVEVTNDFFSPSTTQDPVSSFPTLHVFFDKGGVFVD
jgi:hypothetical protein